MTKYTIGFESQKIAQNPTLTEQLTQYLGQRVALALKGSERTIEAQVNGVTDDKFFIRIDGAQKDVMFDIEELKAIFPKNIFLNYKIR